MAAPPRRRNCRDRLRKVTTAPPIRDAASVVLVRDGRDGPRVLMGQRAAGAAFMPSKFVFPGGAVDPGDGDVALASPLPERSARRIGAGAGTFAATALRELAEETGLLVGTEAPWPDAPVDWAMFRARGLRPSASPLHYMFRAITPPGLPRRFDARFFLVDAMALSTDADDLSAASGELSGLQWLSLLDALALDLPFVTRSVLSRVALLIADGMTGDPDFVPFFDNRLSDGGLRRID